MTWCILTLNANDEVAGAQQQQAGGMGGMVGWWYTPYWYHTIGTTIPYHITTHNQPSTQTHCCNIPYL